MRKSLNYALAAASVVLGIAAGAAGSNGALLADGPVGEDPQIRPGVADVIAVPPETYPPGIAATDTSSDPPKGPQPPGIAQTDATIDPPPGPQQPGAAPGGPIVAGFNWTKVGTEGAY
jgi:hypothetical protein